MTTTTLTEAQLFYLRFPPFLVWDDLTIVPKDSHRLYVSHLRDEVLVRGAVSIYVSADGNLDRKIHNGNSNSLEGDTPAHEARRLVLNIPDGTLAPLLKDFQTWKLDKAKFAKESSAPVVKDFAVEYARLKNKFNEDLLSLKERFKPTVADVFTNTTDYGHVETRVKTYCPVTELYVDHLTDKEV